MKEHEEVFTKDNPFGIIYRVTNLINGKVYIGQTRQGLSIRKAHHIRDYNNKSHESIVLYKAFRKYGLESFKWEAIDTAGDITELNEKEIEWIEIHGANKGKGYNMTSGGQGVRGYVVTEDGIQRRKDVFNRMWANGHAATVQSGEAHSRAIFTNDQVREIVQHLIKRDLTEEQLAIKYNVSKQNIYSIKNRNSYKYQIGDEDVIKMNERREGEYKRIKEITKEQVLQMKDLLLNTSIPSIEIYSMYDITHGQFNNILYHSEFSSLFTEEEVRFSRNRRQARMLLPEEVIEIKELLQEGLYTQKEISMIFGTESKNINRIAKGERWGNILIDLPMEDIEYYEWKFID